MNASHPDNLGLVCCYSKNRFEVYTASGALFLAAIDAEELDRKLDEAGVVKMTYSELAMMKHRAALWG